MARLRPFLICFLPAFLLTKILTSTLNFSGFSFAEPALLDFVLEVVFSLAGWAVSVIVYVTLRDGLRAQREKKEKKGESHEVS